MVDPQKVYFSRDDKLVVWRIQADGSHREILVDAARQQHLSLSAPITVSAPTGDIIPDGFGGVLFSIRSSAIYATQRSKVRPTEFVYRVTQEGELAYKFLLPKYSGPLHDEMVLGEQDLGFATRGSILIAFNVATETKSGGGTPANRDFTINMATAGGGCFVETPEGIVLGGRRCPQTAHGAPWTPICTAQAYFFRTTRMVSPCWGQESGTNN